MATYNKVEMNFDGKTFVGTGNIQVTEFHQPFWLFDGAQRLRTLAEQVNFLDNDTSQAYVGTGSRVRGWRVSFTQWEGSADAWGDASDSDDIVVKLNELGQSLAEAGIDSTSPATFEYGEYTSAGDHSAQDVVPGEISLPVSFGPGESATTARPEIEWLDAANLSNVLHSAP